MSETNGYVTRDQLFGGENKGRRFREVDVDGVGTFRLRSLNDKEYTRVNSPTLRKDGSIDRIAAQGTNARLIVACVVDREGNTCLTDSDVSELRELDAGIIQQLAEACRQHLNVDLEGNE